MGPRTNQAETAVILSGGEGVRLRPITSDLPKGLVRVGGKPLLQWVVEWLRENGVSNIVIGVAYLKDEIMEFLGDGSQFGVRIRYSVHSVEGGTGEGFRLAISRFVKDEIFVALNGDQITDLRLSPMIEDLEKNDALATIAVVHPRLPFGQLFVGKNGYCEGFSEKPILKDVFISSGIYVFNKEILKYLPTHGDVEKTTFPQLTQLKRLRAYRHDGSFLTVNSLRELDEAEEQLRRQGNK